MAAAAAPADYPLVYGLWTNKGGVGKSTLGFHLACSYAELFPNKSVVCIDMCPQSNLSATLLTNTTDAERRQGDRVVADLQTTPKILCALPRTIGGFLMNLVGDNEPVPPQDWLVKVSSFNRCLPTNMSLFCGDRSLDSLAAPLLRKAGDESDVTSWTNPYRRVHVCLRQYIEKLAKDVKQQSNTEVVVFIDTNPALSITTQIALVAMTHLIIPVNADSFSMQAIQSMFHLVYGLYPCVGPAREFEVHTFASKARRYELPLPKIAAIMNNRSLIVGGQANQGGRAALAYLALASSHAGLLFDGYKKAIELNELDRVFKTEGVNGGQPFNDNQIVDFSKAYSGTMRDMRSTGVAALTCGFPVYLIKSKKAVIKTHCKVKCIGDGAINNILQDMWLMMQAVFGVGVMATADPAAVDRMKPVPAATDDADNREDSQESDGESDRDSDGGAPPAQPAKGPKRSEPAGRAAGAAAPMSQAAGKNAKKAPAKKK